MPSGVGAFSRCRENGVMTTRQKMGGFKFKNVFELDEDCARAMFDGASYFLTQVQPHAKTQMCALNDADNDAKKSKEAYMKLQINVIAAQVRVDVISSLCDFFNSKGNFVANDASGRIFLQSSCITAVEKGLAALVKQADEFEEKARVGLKSKKGEKGQRALNFTLACATAEAVKNFEDWFDPQEMP